VVRKAHLDDLDGSMGKFIHETDGGQIQANNGDFEGTEEFIYVPYQSGLGAPKPLGAGQNDGFVVRTQSVEYKNAYPDLAYPAPGVVVTGRYLPMSAELAFGKLNFKAACEIVKTNTITSFVSNVPDVYSNYDYYNSVYFVSSKNGLSLNWYFVSTNPIHDVNYCKFIGTGIYVFFNLLRDTALYLEIDDTTGRAFIYSAELLFDQLTVMDHWETLN